MSSAARYLFLALLASILTYLSGCSSTGDSEYKSVHQTSSDATFPIPPGIEDNVEFWRKVYGEMDRSQVVIHDNEYMSIIYEVVEVPGSGESRRAFAKGKQQEYRDRLATLERKVTYGESLTSAEEEMKAELEAVGGRNAIFGAADRVRTQQGMRERFRSGMEISGRYDQAFREIFRKHGVPEDLAFLPHVESSFQSKARSGVGAAGLWQFMPATGRVYDLQVDHKLDERMDPLLACEGRPVICPRPIANWVAGPWPSPPTTTARAASPRPRASMAATSARSSRITRATPLASIRAISIRSSSPPARSRAIPKNTSPTALPFTRRTTTIAWSLSNPCRPSNLPVITGSPFINWTT